MTAHNETPHRDSTLLWKDAHDRLREYLDARNMDATRATLAPLWKRYNKSRKAAERGEGAGITIVREDVDRCITAVSYMRLRFPRHAAKWRDQETRLRRLSEAGTDRG